MTAPECFRFVLPARLKYRDAARTFLTYLCHSLAEAERIDETVVHKVTSAFVEAFNNAVLHGADDHTSLVEVDLRVDTEQLTLTIRDQGRGFAEEEIPAPDLDSLPEGGLGIFIMRNFMDSVDYAREDGWNVVTMTKQLARGTGDLIA